MSCRLFIVFLFFGATPLAFGLRLDLGFTNLNSIFLSCFVFALEVVWCAQVVLVTALSAVGGFGGPPRDR